MSLPTVVKLPEKYRPVVDHELCIRCKKCVRSCSYDVLELQDDRIRTKPGCVACLRCVYECPKQCITVKEMEPQYAHHAVFDPVLRRSITAQANSGGVLLSSCGANVEYMDIFSHLLLDAAQVTNPSIDPLREPVETRTYLGRRPGKVTVTEDGRIDLHSSRTPLVVMDMPIMIGHISLGSISYNAQAALFQAASELNIVAGTGEGGLHADFYKHSKNLCAEVASGRFGVTSHYLKEVSSVEIKIGQGPNPGI